MSPRPNVEAERRQQILETAMVCFARKGYYSTTMDELAAELPFSKALLYYYFKTKRDIFLAILDDWLDNSLAAWETIASQDGDATTQLCECLEYGAQLVSLNIDLVRVEFEFYSEMGRDEEVAKAIRALFSRFRTEFKAILDAGIVSGEFRPVNTDALAATLLGAYEGLAMQASVEPDALDWSVVGKSLFEIIMQGISPDTKE
jgi:AcrR family transcriptional regulator